MPKSKGKKSANSKKNNNNNNGGGNNQNNNYSNTWNNTTYENKGTTLRRSYSYGGNTCQVCKEPVSCSDNYCIYHR